MKDDKKTIKLGAMYIRESTEEQDSGYSPDRQKRAIEEYAEKNKIKIVKTYKDLISGRSASKRPEFQQMIADAKDGKFNILLYFHTSRFARNVEESRKYKKLLRSKYGIDVVSVTQPFGDHNRPDSFLNEGINELFDQYYSEQLSFWMRQALAEKRQQGYPLGNPPLGYYKKTGNTKEWFVDEDAKKIIVEMFKLYAKGTYSLAGIAELFNKKGYLTKNKGPFTHSSISVMLKNSAYIGMVKSKQKGVPDLPGKHEPIIYQKLFYQVQEAFNQRATSGYGRPVSEHRFYLLQGLLYCQPCAKHLEGKEDNPNALLLPRMVCKTQIAPKSRKESYYYGCKFKRENRSCKQPDVKCEIFDDQILKYMKCFHLPDEAIEEVLSKLEALFDKAEKSPAGTDMVKKLNDRRKRVNHMFEVGAISPEEYNQKVKAIDSELKNLDDMGAVKGNHKIKKKIACKLAERFLRDFGAFWESDNISREEKRKWILLTIKRIWVKNKKVVAIEPHDEFKGLFVSTKKVYDQSPIGTPK